MKFGQTYMIAFIVIIIIAVIAAFFIMTQQPAGSFIQAIRPVTP
ncbi:MAG: hypothetical protein ABIJ92_00380 [Candidatus Aenigmatarchaeota archaeon]